LTGISALPIFFVILIIALSVTFLTEATSNTATTALLMPVLAAAALGINIDPMILMIPATMSASCAFMLPVATPPNAIVYGSGKITIPEMSKAGLWLNIMFILLLTLASLTLISWVFGIEVGVLPSWAQ
jgi:sodium-dependent dicarboxylate transporter 2/3/5